MNAVLSARWVRTGLAVLFLIPGLALAVAVLTPAPASASVAKPGAHAARPGVVGAPSCGVGGYGGQPAAEPLVSDPSIVARIGDLNSGQMPSPAGMVIDAGDPRGRVFVTNLTAGTLSVIDGRASLPAWP